MALKTAWESTIAKYYNVDAPSPHISSEAALQAYLLHELIVAVKGLEASGDMPLNTRVFIEPVTDPDGITPDLIICRNKTVIAVVELKYTPRIDLVKSEESSMAGVKKDLNGFETLYKRTHSDEATSPSFLHNRYRGEFSEESEKFIFSKQTLFVWAGVHGSTGKSLKEAFPSREALQGIPIFEMHANALNKSKARIAYFFDGQLEDVV